MTQARTYPVIFSILFWLLWFIGGLALLVLGFFTFMTLMMTLEAGLRGSEGVGLLGFWNLLITAAEGFVLYRSARDFGHPDKSVFELLLWALVAVVGIPLLAFGGCVMSMP